MDQKIAVQPQTAALTPTMSFSSNWDQKHDPESLIDYGQPNRPNSNALYHDHTHDYHDPYSELEQSRNSNHLQDLHKADYRLSNNGSTMDSKQQHKSYISDDFSSTGSLIKSAGEFSGTELPPNLDKPPIEQMGMSCLFVCQRFSSLLPAAISEPQQQPKSFFGKMMDQGRFPLEQRIENKKRGIGRQKYPILSKPILPIVVLVVIVAMKGWALTVAMVAIMIYELVRNDQEQGSPISTKPVFNPLIGPSQSALINFGRSVHLLCGITDTVRCTLSSLYEDNFQYSFRP